MRICTSTFASTDACLRLAGYGMACKVGGQHINGDVPVVRRDGCGKAMSRQVDHPEVVHIFIANTDIRGFCMLVVPI